MSMERVPKLVGPVLFRMAAVVCLIALASWVTWWAHPHFGPWLVDNFGFGGDHRVFGPIVVVGVIRANDLVHFPVPQHSDPSYLLALNRMRLDVELVLRGDIGCGLSDVYYFYPGGPFNGPPLVGRWYTGDRRVFSLERDQGVLRMACEGADVCTFPVFSGAHPNFKVDPHKPIEETITDLLMTRGEGYVSDWDFANAVVRGGVASDEYSIQVWRRIALVEGPEVKGAACVRLWDNAGAWDYQRNNDFLSASEKKQIRRDSASAAAAMREANCICVASDLGGADCDETPLSLRDPLNMLGHNPDWVFREWQQRADIARMREQMRAAGMAVLTAAK